MRGKHVVVETVVYPNFLAPHHLPKDTLGNLGLYVVGTRTARAPYVTRKQREDDYPTKALLIAGLPADVERFASEVAAGPGKSALDWDEICRLHSFTLPDPEKVLRGVPTDLGDHDRITWQAVLNPIGRDDAERERLGDEAFSRLVALVVSAGGAVDDRHRRIIDGVTFVPIALDLQGARRVAEFNLLRSLRPMPRMRTVPRPTTRAVFARPVAACPHETPKSDRRVAVFDGGIAPGCAALTRFTTVHNLTPVAPTEEYLTHGSTVTCAVLFGSQGSGPLPQPAGFVDHYRVFPVPEDPTFDNALDWVLGQIEVVVRQGQHRIVHLSLGPDECVSEDVPSLWTATLDRLAAEYDVTFVVAAGNNGEEDAELGFNRVQVPADAVNVIGVGACDSPDTSKKLVRAPYSAVGPSRDGQRVQPVGVAFGGVLPAAPFWGIDAHGRKVGMEGTSFGAPLATRGLLELEASLGDARWSAATARTFAAHYARPRPRGHKVAELGYGRLAESYATCWECAPNEVTVLYEDVLPRAATLAMYMPFPRGIEDDVPIDLTWTLAFTASVDVADAAEYTQDGLELHFRPHERIRNVRDLVSRDLLATLDLERDKAALDAILAQRAADVGDIPVADSNWRGMRAETLLRAAGKWETLVKGRLPTRPAAELYRPRLDVSYLRREHGSLKRDGVEPLSISMLVTMRAPLGVPLYDRVAAQFRVLTPIHSQITLSSTG
jgi:hypothetical protein